MLEKKVLIVDQEQTTRRLLSQALREWSFVPVEAINIQSALELFDHEQPFITLLDLNFPDGYGLDLLRTIKQRQPGASVIIVTKDVLVENTIAAFRDGANDFIAKPISLEELKITIDKCSENSKSNLESVSSTKEFTKDSGFEQIKGESPQIKELILLARKVAESEVSSLLLQGESGTGKDMFAKAIHFSSPRSRKPFVSINCAAIPANLIESELFGHEKGAFTDAKTSKEGLFEQAKGGTIFLDEIGELELRLQAKLLRVLEEGIFRRVGGLRELKLNACIIAASNRNLREQSELGNFRSDLYFRLSVIEIDIPPLRERGDDVLILATHFIKKFEQDRYKSKPRRLSPKVANMFRRYQWSGNVRELRNVIERALILEESEQITLKSLPLQLTRYFSSPDLNSSDDLASSINIILPPKGISLDEVENLLINQALDHTKGNVTRASQLLRISRDQMRYRLKKKKQNELDKEKKQNELE